MEKKRQEALQRLEKLKIDRADFYKRYPNLLEQLEKKIEALKSGTGYKIKNVQYLIPYTFSKTVTIQMLDVEGKKKLGQIKNQKFTTADAEKLFWDDVSYLLDRSEVEAEFKYNYEEISKYERFVSKEQMEISRKRFVSKEQMEISRKRFVEKQKIIHKDIKDRLSYLNKYR